MYTRGRASHSHFGCSGGGGGARLALFLQMYRAEGMLLPRIVCQLGILCQFFVGADFSNLLRAWLLQVFVGTLQRHAVDYRFGSQHRQLCCYGCQFCRAHWRCLYDRCTTSQRDFCHHYPQSVVNRSSKFGCIVRALCIRTLIKKRANAK